MGFKLRPYQLEAVNATMAALAQHQKVALILPTGSGKTEIFIDIAKRHAAKGTGTTLVLSHLDILTRQTLARFRLRAPDMRCSVMQAQEKPHVLSKVVISTMQSSRMEHKADQMKQRLLRDVDQIIVDEAHLIQTDSYQKVLSYWPNAKIIGVTATPFRDNQIMTNYFDSVPYSMSLGELIEIGYLVPPVLFQMKRESHEIEDVMAQVVKTYQEREDGKGAIVFMKTIKDAKAIRNVFRDVGIPAESITSKVTGEYRDDTIGRFNSGEIRILTTVNVLTAGFDSPRVDSIFMPYPVKSTTQYVQRIGRGLRIDPERGKKDCRVYVFGSAPSISRRFYEKVHNLAMNEGGKIKEYDTVTETLEFNDWENSTEERHLWTQQIAETVRRMEKVGMLSLSEKLNRKEFPKRFLQNITDLLSKLPSTKRSLPHGNVPATVNQTRLLKNFNFTDQQMQDLTKSEASMMISSIVGDRMKGEFTITSGKHQGKHISELPFAYRSYVLKNMPSSNVAQLIRKWNNGKSNNRNGHQTAKAVPNQRTN